ncbi:MAG: peptidoglycan-binding protein [Chthoniobacterales bacterium]
MKRTFQWLVLALGGLALAATVEANPPTQSNSNGRPVARRPAPRGDSGLNGAGYRSMGPASGYRPTSLPNYGARAPIYSGGQRFSSMPTGQGSAFRSAPVRSYGGSTPTYSGGQRFSARPTSDSSWRQTFPRSNFQRPSSGEAISNSGTTSTRTGTSFDRTTTRNQAGSFQTTRSGRRTQTSGFNPTGSRTTQNHVFATRSANWQPNWNRNRDHWWNGHRCRFVNNSWVIFDFGFYPWFGYPYAYGYGYDYYPYGYGYGYDPGYGYDDGGYYYGGDQGYGQDGSGSYGQDGDSSVAAAQEQLARLGYYRGNIDGVFGPETQRALSGFQRDRGLDASGYLTLETRRALGLRG